MQRGVQAGGCQNDGDQTQRATEVQKSEYHGAEAEKPECGEVYQIQASFSWVAGRRVDAVFQPEQILRPMTQTP